MPLEVRGRGRSKVRRPALAVACCLGLVLWPARGVPAQGPGLEWVEQTNARGEHFHRYQDTQDGVTVTFDLYPQVDAENRLVGYRVVVSTASATASYKRQATIGRTADGLGYRVKGYTMRGKLISNELVPRDASDTRSLRAAAASNCDTCDDVGIVLGTACSLIPGPGSNVCQLLGKAAQLYYCMGERAICGTTGDVYDADFPCQGSTHVGTLSAQPKVVRWKDTLSVVGAGWTFNAFIEGWWYDALQWESPSSLRPARSGRAARDPPTTGTR